MGNIEDIPDDHVAPTYQQPDVLIDADRLATIKTLDLMDSVPEEIFDRLTRLVTKLLPTPVALVSIVDDHRQFFKSSIGLGEPWSIERQTALSHSFCQYVVMSGQPLIVEDALNHSLVKDNLAIPDLGVVSYLGMPLTLSNGQTVGSFCAIDTETRQWTPQEIEIVRELAQSVITELELRNEVIKLRETQRERDHLIAELQTLNQDLADFAYIVSHDLKAPLRGIRSISEWLYADYFESVDADGQEMLVLMQKRVGRLQDFIDGVLRYSRIGRIEDDWEWVDTHSLALDIIGALEPPDNIHIRIKNHLPTVFGGYVRLEQIFQNLISNAIKFMDKPEGLVEIWSEPLEGYWEFHIKDNGQGIEERHFQKIFQIFQTLTARDDFESTGIGLTLVKRIVEIHRGEIRVQSVIGQWTEFIFTISQTIQED